MTESQADYWARRANEHARLAMSASHRAAMAAHNALARAYQRRVDEWKSAASG
jgi:hypothetical protein